MDWFLYEMGAEAGTIIPPASDDSVGSVGSSDKYAREDHKHPEQTIAVLYRGALAGNANLTGSSTGNTYVDGTSSYSPGDMFLISSTGSLVVNGGTVPVVSGDQMIINKEVTKAVIASTDLDVHDSTDAVQSVNGEVGSVVVTEIGDYKQSIRTSNHGKWLICNGQAVSRTMYAALFALLGTSFGIGDGSTTFNLPDLRGNVFGGVSGSHAVGQFLGSETETLTTSQMPSHSHQTDMDSSGGFVPSGQVAKSIQDGATGQLGGSASDRTGIPYTGFIRSEGGGQAHNNMQPTLFAGNFFIYSG